MRNQPLPDSDPYIQDLVRKSQEMAEQRRQERLANYYKRNFKACPSAERLPCHSAVVSMFKGACCSVFARMRCLCFVYT